MWYYMILDPIKDDALCLRDGLLVPFISYRVNWDSYRSLDKALEAMSIYNGKDLGLPDHKVGRFV